MLKTALIFLILLHSALFAQSDTTTFPWPVTPFDSPHEITGVFSEYRGPSNPHFHNGTDIPKPDGSPVYSVFNGVLQSLSPTGENAFVRVAYANGGTDAYVHIQPNPLLTVGSPVTAKTTVLGTILSGLGHVHFTNGPVSPEATTNAIRPEGGLAPFIDLFPPRIASVGFYVNGTTFPFEGNRISGLADIWVHVREETAPNSSLLRESTSNNGTYTIGYKVLSADRSAVVFEPPVDGLRFQFDRKPSDSYVNSVYARGSDNGTHVYIVTNGNGAGSLAVPDGYWDTRSFPPGQYVVMVFTEDTRTNTDTSYVSVEVTDQDITPPSSPTLEAIVTDSLGAFTVSWYSNLEPDLAGYRLYFSFDGTDWTVRDNESALTPSRTSVSYSNIGTSIPIYFRLSAVDTASQPNESIPSDVYGVRLNTSTERYLIVDGFDRTQSSGSYHEPSHPFSMTHGMSVPFDFNTCANEAIILNSVRLSDFDAVIWVLGDESTADETFSPDEQLKLQEYLTEGGKLFVSGSEVAWDLDRTDASTEPSQSDRDFFHSYLKAIYRGDDADSYIVLGTEGLAFGGLSFGYGDLAQGSPYEEDWPDFVDATGGSQVVLKYANGLNAGIAYTGTFGSGAVAGAIVYLGFPFETIHSKAMRDSVMQRVVQFFDQVTSIGFETSAVDFPKEFRLEQNYPNPFNPRTKIRFDLPAGQAGVGGLGVVSLKVYNVLGQEVATLVNEELKPGTYEVTWDAAGFSSGVYVYRLQARPTDGGQASQLVATKKLLLLR